MVHKRNKAQKDRLRWVVSLGKEVIEAIFRALAYLLFRHPKLLLACLLYFSVTLVLGSLLILVVYVIGSSVIPTIITGELKLVTEVPEGIVGVFFLIATIPIYGFGIALARRILSGNDRPIHLRHWRKWFRIGLEVTIIYAVFTYLPELLINALFGQIIDISSDFLIQFVGLDLTKSVWYDRLVLAGAKYVFPAVVLIYIHEKRFSDVFSLRELEKYTSILGDPAYITIALASIISSNIIYLILYSFGENLFVYRGFVFDFVGIAVAGMLHVFQILLPFIILGQNARSIDLLSRKWSVFCDTTIQTSLSRFTNSRKNKASTGPQTAPEEID